MAVEVFVRVDDRPGLWRFLEQIGYKYVVLSPSGRPDVVDPRRTRIVAHKMTKT